MSTREFPHEVPTTKILTYDWQAYQQQVAVKPRPSLPSLRKGIPFAVLSGLLIWIALLVSTTGDLVAFAAVGVVVSTLIGCMIGALKN